MNYFLIALGGALGSVGRFWLNGFVTVRSGETFPIGTLLINVVGSFVIGLVAAWPGVSEAARKFLMVGVCGGFTTFSAFSLQTLELTQRGEWLRASVNILASVALCLAAVWLGQVVAGQK